VSLSEECPSSATSGGQLSRNGDELAVNIVDLQVT